MLTVQIEKFKENRVFRNSFYGVIQFVVPTMLLLGFTPVFIHKMGIEPYGLWMLATSALGLMGIAEFGLNTAISKFVAEFVESGNTDKLSAVVSFGLVAYICLGFGLIVPLYIFSPALSGIFKSSQAISGEQVGLVVRTMSLGFVPLLLRSGAMAIPIGLQRFQVPVLVTVGYQILSYTIALVVVYWEGSVTQVVSSTVAVLWIMALVSLFVAWQMLQPFKLKFAITHSWEVMRRMLSFSLMSGISGIGGQIFNFADRLAVGAVLGLDAVAYYTIIIGVASKILQFSSALTSALMPAVSSWMTSGNVRRVRSYFLRATAVLLGFNFLVASILLILSDTVLRFWMGEAFAFHVIVPFRILVMVYAGISVNAPAYYVAYGMGIPYLSAIAAILGGLLTIGLIFLLGPGWNLTGAAVANLGFITTFIQPIGVWIYLRSRLQEEKK